VGSPGDLKRLQVIKMVKFKLSAKDHRRIKIKAGVLKLSERFWLGPEFTQAEVRDYIAGELKLGFSVGAWKEDVETELVPECEERLSSLLGRRGDRRVAVQVVWSSLAKAENYPAALETLHRGRSALVLGRVLEAVKECVERFVAGRERLADHLAAVRIRLVPAISPAKQGVRVKQCSRADFDRHLGKHPQRPTRLGPVSFPTGGQVLKINARLEVGEEGCPSIGAIRDALTSAISMEDPDLFQINYIRHTPDQAEVHGKIADFNKFVLVFRSLEELQARSRNPGAASAAKPPASAPAEEPPRPRKAPVLAVEVQRQAPTSQQPRVPSPPRPRSRSTSPVNVIARPVSRRGTAVPATAPHPQPHQQELPIGYRTELHRPVVINREPAARPQWGPVPTNKTTTTTTSSSSSSSSSLIRPSSIRPSSTRSSIGSSLPTSPGTRTIVHPSTGGNTAVTVHPSQPSLPSSTPTSIASPVRSAALPEGGRIIRQYIK
jgi:hypothetical protein